MMDPATAPRSVIAFKPSGPPDQIASARLRYAKPAEALRRSGWDIREFDDRRMNEYDAVVFQKTYTEHDLQIVAHLRGLGVATAFDLCDNHFVFNDGRLDRLKRMIRAVDQVSVSTLKLAEFVGRDASVIDDALDDVPESPQEIPANGRRLPSGSTLRLIWYGNAGSIEPAFGLVDLARILPELESVHAKVPIELTVVSNSRKIFDEYFGHHAFPIQYLDWDQRVFAEQFRKHDICLIPISSNPFTVCKTVNRLALALLMGVPVIADVIPSYLELAPFILTGDWVDSILKYAGDPKLASRHVQQGQEFLRQKYTKQRLVLQWSEFLHQLASKRKKVSLSTT